MIGAAIGSAVGGIMSANESKKAGERSSAASAAAAAQRDKAVGVVEGNQANVDAMQEFLTSMGAEGMERAQGLLDDWEGSFGGIQDNLSDYYSNLDPDKFAMSSKAEFTQNMNKQMSQFNETMAASGLQSAGMKAQAAKEAAFKTAETYSQIDINAPEQVNQMKQGFLQYGDSQRAGAENAMSNAMNNQAQYGQAGFNAQTNQANALANTYTGDAQASEATAAREGASASGYAGAAGSMFGSAMNLGIKGYNNGEMGSIMGGS